MPEVSSQQTDIMMPPRKVARTSASDATGTTASNEDYDATFEDNGMNTRRRKEDVLEDMLDMPVDIISEITRHMHPQDLLNLSWSSKSLHKFFMRKSSKIMWKQSFRSLPYQLPFPDGIIEPAWAMLLFTKFCTVCGAREAPGPPMWAWNARVCSACAHTKIISYRPLEEVLHLRDKMHLAAHIPMAIFTHYGGVYLRSEVEEVVDKWDELSKLEDEEALATFIGRCFLRANKASAHVARCEQWITAHAQAVRNERIALEKDYLKNVVSRLRALGWGDELRRLKKYDYWALRRHEHFRTPQRLTDDVWQAIQDDMVQCMERIKRDRLRDERAKLRQKRWNFLQPTLMELSRRPEARAYDINVGDIAFMPEIREIADAANDAVVNEASLEEVSAKFPDMIERWKDTAAHKLRELVMKSRPVPDPPQPEPAKRTTRSGKAKAEAERKFDVLELATTRFHCKRCDGTSKALYYPGLLAHACLRDCSCSTREDVYTQFVFRRLRDLQTHAAILRNFDLLSVAQPSAAATAVIQLCGKDPEVVTADEMNALGVMLLRGDKNIRSWRSAILFDDRQRHTSQWTLASRDEVATAEEHLPDIEEREYRYRCVKCDSQDRYSGPWQPNGALEHLRKSHSVGYVSLQHRFLEGELAPDSLMAADVIKMKLDRRYPSEES